MSALAEESGRSVDEIKNDVKTIAKEYQKNGDNIPLSYKKAYDKIGVYSETAEQKMKKSSEAAKKSLKDDADDIGDSHKENSEKTSRNWEKTFSVMGSVASSGLKVFTAGVTAAATGVATLGTSAIKSYADFEQLVGGVETLFGAGGASIEEYAESVGKSVDDIQDEYNQLLNAQKTVLENANNAYKTAGLSANDYMETVTSFSASLISSLGGDTWAAAEYADRAITDMSDNANKMGSDISLIQNAYQGFAKQNYTMLDNLKLGYGGTKEEMQRLITDAAKLTDVQNELGVTVDANSLSFGNIVNAISVMQASMGIAGTTAEEAEKTISGSISSMSAAWTNLVTGIADDNADFEQLIENFVDSAVIVANNLIPRIETTLQGIGQLIEELLPIIVAKIPEIVNSILPDLLESGVNMVVTIVGGISSALPALLDVAGNLITELLTGISDNANSVFNSGSEILLELVSGFAEMIPELLTTAADAIVSMALALTEPRTLDNIIQAGIDLLLGLVRGITDALPKLMAAAPTILANLVSAIIRATPQLLSAATEILARLAGYILDSLTKFMSLGVDFLSTLRDSFTQTDWASLGTNIINGIWRGLKNGWSWLTGKVSSLANDLFKSAKKALGINSPSKKFEWIADMCIAGMDEPLEDYNPYDTLQNSMEANIGGLKSTFEASVAYATDGFNMDYSALGDEMKNSLQGVGIYMDGQKVGQLITPTVNSELAVYDNRRT